MSDSLDGYTQMAAEAMAKDIDREVLWGMLSSIGWSRVIINTATALDSREEIAEWLKVNCKHPYEAARSDFLFESQQDANWFKLRWYS